MELLFIFVLVVLENVQAIKIDLIIAYFAGNYLITAKNTKSSLQCNFRKFQSVITFLF